MKKDLPCVWQKKLSINSKILVSSCLLGNVVRYDAKSKSHDLSLLKDYELIPCCPEVDGGLDTPRPKSEMVSNSKVVNIEGVDVSSQFHKGAKIALEIAKKEDIKVAILKSKSPSCSNHLVYDGSFSGKLIKRKGITCQLLEQNGIKVFDETELEKALVYLKEMEQYE